MELRDLIFISLWTIAGLRFALAIWRGRLRERQVRRVWWMFGLMILSLSLWGPEAEQMLDQWFSDLPVALYIKYIGFIVTAYMLNVILLEGLHRRPSRFFRWFAPVMLVAGGLSFGIYTIWQPISPASLRYNVLAIRDGVTLFYLLFAIAPHV